jgi:hypothetical protein
MPERGVKSPSGGIAVQRGASTQAATSSETCSLDKFTIWRPSRSYHGEGNIDHGSTEARGGLRRGTGSSMCVRRGAEHERPVWATLVGERRLV